MRVSLSRPKTPSRLTAADVRATEVVDLAPLSSAGRHATYTARLADSGEAVFVKHNALENLVRGPLARINSPIDRGMQAMFPHLDRFQDMTETMLSHVLKGYFTDQGRPYSGITYQEVLARQDGRNQLCIAAPMVPDLGTLDHLPASAISNPAEAVEGTLLRGLLLGDYDVSFNNSNNALATQNGRMSDGTPIRQGQVLLMDFGEGGHDNNSYLGVPYGSAAILNEYPQYIEPAMRNILKLDAAQVHKLVAAGGEHVTGWNDALTDHFSNVLQSNLDRVRQTWQKNPQHFDPTQSHNPLRSPRHAALKMCLMPARGLGNYFSLLSSGVLHQIPDNQATADQVASLLPPYPGERFTSS